MKKLNNPNVNMNNLENAYKKIKEMQEKMEKAEEKSEKTILLKKIKELIKNRSIVLDNSLAK